MPRLKCFKKNQLLREMVKARTERYRKLKLEKEKVLAGSAEPPTAVPSTSSAVFTAAVSSTPSAVFALPESDDRRCDDNDFKQYLALDDESEDESKEAEIIDIPNDSNKECIGIKSPAKVRKLLLDEVRTNEEGSDSACPLHSYVIESTVMFPETVLQDMIAAIVDCRECGGSGNLTLTKHDFDNDVLVKCDTCANVIYEKKAEMKVVTGFKKAKTSRCTTGVVYNTIQEGTGHAGVNNFCASLGFPAMSQRAYEKNKGYIHKLCKDKYLETQEKVYSAIVNYYRKINIHPDNDGILNIDGIFDGTWMTRGHSSTIGVGVLSEAYTGFILDAHVLSKLCQVCTSQKKMLDSKKWTQAEYEEKVGIHSRSGKCTKNFEGSSGMMESESAKIIWGRSLESKFRYTVLVGDGDSSAYNAVINMNNGKGPYGEEHPVVKEECINHFAKRLGARLRNVRERYVEKTVTKTGKVRFHKYLGGKGKLSDLTIGHLVRNLGSAMRRAKVYKNNKVSKLRNDVLATFHHITSTDESPDHSLCPSGETSFCFYKAAIANNETPRSHQRMKVKLSLPDDAKKIIKDVYESLTSDELLLKCIKGRTQNLNESFNGKLWAKCPKVKYHGLNRVTNAYHIAACEHNTGYMESSLSQEIIGSPPGSAQRWKEKRRLRSSLQPATKKRKSPIKLVKDADYQAGGF